MLDAFVSRDKIFHRIIFRSAHSRFHLRAIYIKLWELLAHFAHLARWYQILKAIYLSTKFEHGRLNLAFLLAPVNLWLIVPECGLSHKAAILEHFLANSGTESAGKRELWRQVAGSDGAVFDDGEGLKRHATTSSGVSLLALRVLDGDVEKGVIVLEALDWGVPTDLRYATVWMRSEELLLGQYLLQIVFDHGLRRHVAGREASLVL